ncbi:uncharacterized protein FOMMEDRAFT_16371 [Fomitiporia mediterranea MF3/22]|uniref:uncharacterized protein n=1 Tax=Fomitiporia mediterranea (strain MF3/22) TaxID=694068 RepID=UPI0004407485|nr:uncharacterized protein FOMMEDRAFT_16371 [Fomitiporia mediterranea MF3/22]EJD07772.1 hypothetical protein FOMMEDRAFT_16371 [Fomitiporia mediterranea MF3/22]
MAVPQSNFPITPNVMVPPPLPPGWTEHRAPSGHPYYYNTLTKESTYVRPMPALSVAAQSLRNKDKKKEKPKIKTPVPGTAWMRVITTLGNVFYTHTERKQSVWSVPDEIKEAVEQMEREEKEKEVQEARKKRADEEELRLAVEKEVERLRNEVEADVAVKRKPEPIDEIVVSKRARVDEEEAEEESEGEEEEDEEEDWQREAAAQLAAEAEAEERRVKEEEERRKRDDEEDRKRNEMEKGTPALNMPTRVDLSTEEAKALFKTLLREKDINPLLPWDTALPQFVSDPRYVLLPSVSARKDAFDEYCRDRARELRQAKLAAQNATASEDMKDPKAEFDKLLHEEVKSTRTSWTEWRRTWKKDRRFYGWGRDDREREKRFRDWLKELGEQKRKAAAKAESDFFMLLKEKTHISQTSSWKDVKRGLDKDPRYDAVGSSSLREELFNTYKKSLSGEAQLTVGPSKSDTSNGNEADQKRKDRERKERAIKEREEQVRRERGRVETEMNRSRKALSREESELEFMTLLTDAIREPTATWTSSLDQLKTDPRFTHSILPNQTRQTLFHKHVGALRNKHLLALHALFEAHAPVLNTEFAELPISSIQTSLPAQKLRLDNDTDALEREYREWRAARTARAEHEFQDMLNENAFIEFWGRVRKMREEGEGGIKVEIGAEDLAGEEDESGKIDLKTLAKSVDVQEIERVLKNDKRYTVFDHIPDQREKWIRAHIEKLAAPKLSVHISEHGR